MARKYYFTLTLTGADVLTDETFDALAECCDDAVFGQRNGYQFADFDRISTSACEAISSAQQDVESVAGITVSEVKI